MIFCTHKPAYPLSQFIDRLWFYDGYCPSPTMERLLPDGTAELVIDLKGGPKRWFNRNNYDRFESFSKSWISGKHTAYIVIEAAADSSMIGTHFKPGGTYPFLGFPVCEVTNQVVELDAVRGNHIHSVRDEILEAPTPAEKLRVLERVLLQTCRNRIRASRAVDHAIALLARSPHRHGFGRDRRRVGRGRVGGAVARRRRTV